MVYVNDIQPSLPTWNRVNFFENKENFTDGSNSSKNFPSAPTLTSSPASISRHPPNDASVLEGDGALLVVEVETLVVEVETLLIVEVDPLLVTEFEVCPLVVTEADVSLDVEADALLVVEADTSLVAEVDASLVENADPLPVVETDAVVFELVGLSLEIAVLVFPGAAVFVVLVGLATSSSDCSCGERFLK